MNFFLIFFPILTFFIIGFVIGKLTATKQYNDKFYDYGFVSGYEACRLDLIGGKKQ